MLSLTQQQFLENQDLSHGYIHALRYGFEHGLDVEDVEPYLAVMSFVKQETILLICQILLQDKIG